LEGELSLTRFVFAYGLRLIYSSTKLHSTDDTQQSTYTSLHKSTKISTSNLSSTQGKRTFKTTVSTWAKNTKPEPKPDNDAKSSKRKGKSKSGKSNDDDESNNTAKSAKSASPTTPIPTSPTRTSRTCFQRVIERDQNKLPYISPEEELTNGTLYVSVVRNVDTDLSDENRFELESTVLSWLSELYT
jgi:hypothetical protein